MASSSRSCEQEGDDLVAYRCLRRRHNYDLAGGVLRRGTVFALTQAEHAAMRGADPTSVAVRTPPTRTTYAVGEPLDRTGLVVTADYTDGVRPPGHGGYTVSGYGPTTAGAQTVIVSYSVAGATRTASFPVQVVGSWPDDRRVMAWLSDL
ncbi:bacterial Ig-like domain-containing protein [Micromonospora sp. NPDC005220]|uniref:bacterial Ig-like domain-containing protein n=1 Tax=Micromonospora sp. NPDC005220 TaxID=3155589 RepID=UPI0033BCC120